MGTDWPVNKLYQAAKTRAKRDGLPFDITYQDVIIPAHCPVLGIELEPCVGTHGPSDNSPSIDKIIPELGYVKDNIRVTAVRLQVEQIQLVANIA
jgi:hypothetical protein